MLICVAVHEGLKGSTCFLVAGIRGPPFLYSPSPQIAHSLFHQNGKCRNTLCHALLLSIPMSPQLKSLCVLRNKHKSQLLLKKKYYNIPSCLLKPRNSSLFLYIFFFQKTPTGSFFQGHIMLFLLSYPAPTSNLTVSLLRWMYLTPIGSNFRTCLNLITSLNCKKNLLKSLGRLSTLDLFFITAFLDTVVFNHRRHRPVLVFK